MQRREFLKNGASLLSLFPLINTGLFNAKLFGCSMNEDVVRMKVGAISCTLFRDTMFKYLGKDYFINASADEVNNALSKFGATADNIPSPFIAVLLQHKDRKVLIDTGVGFMEKPVEFKGKTLKFEGRLKHLLLRENISNEDITDVVITHFHPDHIGGVYAGGHLNFPNAQFHMHEAEWSYWHSGQSDNQSPAFRYFIETQITPLKKQNINLFKGDFVEILPGITAVQAQGHTPGQVALIIHSDDKRLLYASDAFLHPLHIERLDWQTSYDMDHQTAKQSRIKLLDLAYQENMHINAFHFDFPGLGRVDKCKNGWHWNYSNK